ncbi:MAG: DUF58 domain-containing protein [Verrucomicrobiales bacterium]
MAASIDELLKRVRRLEIRARRLVSESLSGEYHSSFKGQGLDFDDFRPYQAGDDPRFIDWNVSARFDSPHIRQFREERELTVILALDLSASADYGSAEKTKRELAAELAALLGFSASHNGDKTGLLLFSGEPLLYLPPKKGPAHILRLLRETLATPSAGQPTSLATAARFLHRTLPRRSLVFLISDFIDWGFEKPLSTLARQHELIALQTIDPVEKDLPDAGRVLLRDAESGHLIDLNTSNPNVRMGYQKLSRRYREGLRAFFKKNAVDHLEVPTTGDYLPALHRLLKQRARRH